MTSVNQSPLISSSISNNPADYNTVSGKPVAQVFAEIAAPLDPSSIKVRRGPKNSTLKYITAREVIQRFNEAAGIDWHDSYTVIEDVKPIYSETFDGTREMLRPGYVVIRCDLTVCGVTRSGIGIGDRDGFGGYHKQAESDALKRAAIKFRFGIELYYDDPDYYSDRYEEEISGVISGKKAEQMKMELVGWTRSRLAGIGRDADTMSILGGIIADNNDNDVKSYVAEKDAVYREAVKSYVKDYTETAVAAAVNLDSDGNPKD